MVLEPTHRQAISDGMKRYWERRKSMGVEKERFERLQAADAEYMARQRDAEFRRRRSQRGADTAD